MDAARKDPASSPLRSNGQHAARREIRWLFGADGGAAAIHPRGWATFAAHVADDADDDEEGGEEGDEGLRVLRAYHRR